jgi:hypothetical protein
MLNGKKELLPFEIWIRNKVKKQKAILDEIILKQILEESKSKYDNSKKAEIEALKKRLLELTK